jgi:hypothetical protein
MKGRSVHLGDGVADQNFIWAEFAERGTSPPSTEAAKALDAMGSLLGYTVNTGDARGAYTQSLMHGTATWVALRESRWPIWWNAQYKHPVALLVLNINGHVDARGYGEEHCGEQLLKIGWTLLSEIWSGVALA